VKAARPTTVAAYLASLPPEKRAVIEAARALGDAHVQILQHRTRLVRVLVPDPLDRLEPGVVAAAAGDRHAARDVDQIQAAIAAEPHRAGDGIRDAGADAGRAPLARGVL